MGSPYDDELGRKIMRAFEGPFKEWRAISGIARDAGLPRQVVERYIRDHPEFFVRSQQTLGGTYAYSACTSDEPLRLLRR